MSLSQSLKAVLASACACALALAGCSSSESDSTGESAGSADSSATAEAFPVTLAAGRDGEEVTIENQPTAIVSLSPTATETLFAIDAGEAVVAADSYSYYPPEAPTTDLSGFTPNAEAVLEYQPDLVVVSQDSNDIVDSLTAAKVPVLVMGAPDDLDGAYSQMEQLGAATGHVADAASVVAETTRAIEDAVAEVGDKAKGRSYYHEVDPSFYTITNDSFLGDIYSQFGMTSIAADGDNPFPQLNPEAIISANPDVIFLGDAGEGGESAASVAQRPGFNTIPAVKDDAIVELDPDLSSRWSPRIADFVQSLVPTLTALPAPAHS
ncbi:Vitamin B12-binding protein precursor [Corynebacterium ciconiae DSM 44920]|uniref:ABC transporter substrate-binding protein n=1 Tax=Corynebacterium ciconiae TaxID=227319 RepID=UPI000375A3BF|nr:ABC transporter substrate-binding protein [Corynebacterium ciconiae]WKD61275.1 Vitamin B12-binding protein precursor [Corynebacterium ciconiae DSM 44920]